MGPVLFYYSEDWLFIIVTAFMYQKIFLKNSTKKKNHKSLKESLHLRKEVIYICMHISYTCLIGYLTWKEKHTHTY